MHCDSGGAGIRTPVRTLLRSCIYVRRLRSRSPPASTQPAYQRTIFLTLTQYAEATHYASSILRYFRAASSGAATKAGAQETYAASASSELAVVIVPVGFTRTPGPGHAATTSQDPSKPVAPVLSSPDVPQQTSDPKDHADPAVVSTRGLGGRFPDSSDPRSHLHPVSAAALGTIKRCVSGSYQVQHGVR